MPTKAQMVKMWMIAAVLALVFQNAGAQRSPAQAKPDTAGDNSDVAKTLRNAANALGMIRGQVPQFDAINTLEFWGSGTTNAFGQAYKAGGPWPAFKTEYHVALSYNPPSMRVGNDSVKPRRTYPGWRGPAPCGTAAHHSDS